MTGPTRQLTVINTVSMDAAMQTVRVSVCKLQLVSLTTVREHFFIH